MKKTVVLLLVIAFLTVPVVATSADMPYKDVEAQVWYAACIKDVTERDLMNGVGEGLFDPDGTLTRAMLITTLWRMNGCPAPTVCDAFIDVEVGTWYFEAVNWAAEKLVVNGVGNGRFDPTSPVTREQMATILYRWAKGEGLDVSLKDTNIAQLENASDWAEDAVNWAIPRHLLTKVLRSGLPHGGSGYFYDVSSYATRAEVSVLLSRFSREYLDENMRKTPVSVEAAGLENGNCDLLLTDNGGQRLAIYTFTDARVGTHFYAEPVATDVQKTEIRPVYQDLPRTYDDQGRLISITRDGVPVCAVTYDEQGRITDLIIEQTIHYHILYAVYGDPLFVEIENITSGMNAVFALYYEEQDGASILSFWGEDGGILNSFSDC